MKTRYALILAVFLFLPTTSRAQFADDRDGLRVLFGAGFTTLVERNPESVERLDGISLFSVTFAFKTSTTSPGSALSFRVSDDATDTRLAGTFAVRVSKRGPYAGAGLTIMAKELYGQKDRERFAWALTGTLFQVWRPFSGVPACVSVGVHPEIQIWSTWKMKRLDINFKEDTAFEIRPFAEISFAL